MTFDGIDSQMISSLNSAETFYNLDINKATGDVYLEDSVIV